MAELSGDIDGVFRLSWNAGRGRMGEVVQNSGDEGLVRDRIHGNVALR